MKPLELTVYPMWDAGDGTFYADHTDRQWPTNVGYEIYRKRLKDAELAAEWQYQDNRCGQKVEGYGVAHDGYAMGTEEDEIEKLRTVYRFATLPHYDEDQS